MKTVLWTRYGPPDVLKIGEADKPVPKEREILIKIAATTAALGDCEIRALKLPLAFRLPLRLFLSGGSGKLKPHAVFFWDDGTKIKTPSSQEGVLLACTLRSSVGRVGVSLYRSVNPNARPPP